MGAFMDKMAAYGVDTKTTLERFTGDEGLYEKCFYIVLKDKNFEQLGNALSEQNYDNAFSYAHAIKGMVGNMGLTPIYDVVSVITDALRVKDLSNIEQQYNDVKEQMAVLKSLA